MNVGRKLAASVRVAEDVAEDGEKGANDLDGDMPPRSDDLKD